MSRPRKTVLLYADYSIQQSIYTLVLSTRRYRVIPYQLANPRRGIFLADAVLIVRWHDHDASRSVIDAVGKFKGERPPVLVVHPPQCKYWDDVNVTRQLNSMDGMAAVLDALITLVKRKRGPKKALASMKVAA